MNDDREQVVVFTFVGTIFDEVKQNIDRPFGSEVKTNLCERIVSCRARTEETRRND